MMGLRIPKAHKAILEARVREHTRDVDLRYIIIGFGLVTFILFMIISEKFISFEYPDEEFLLLSVTEQLLIATHAATLPLIVYLYLLAKLCRPYPRGARWAIFYSGMIASANHLFLVFFFPAMIVAELLMILYFSTVSFVSVRQIYKYHRNPQGSAKENHE
ncbi:MAG TPA: hypothetical protein VF268_00245 [Gammaproteobacteria bacterium]